MTAAGCLVFDIGGTFMRCGEYDPVTRTIRRSIRAETPRPQGLPSMPVSSMYRALVDRARDLAGDVLDHAPSCVSMAFPGPIDARGRALAAPTIWGVTPREPIDLAEGLRRIWPSARIAVLNDVTAAGFRYLDRSRRDFCIVTVSSGIGNKIFVGGHPYVGPANRGGEIGHAVVDPTPTAPVCECGGRGHLSAISSGRGTLNYVRRIASAQPDLFGKSVLAALAAKPDGITSEDVVRAFHRRDAFAVGCVRKAARPLARVLAGIHAALGLERFVIVGGFATALGEDYRNALAADAASSCWSVGQRWDRMIGLGEPDDMSGLIGAGRYVCEFAGLAHAG